MFWEEKTYLNVYVILCTPYIVRSYSSLPVGHINYLHQFLTKPPQNLHTYSIEKTEVTEQLWGIVLRTKLDTTSRLCRVGDQIQSNAIMPSMNINEPLRPQASSER